MKPFKGNPPLTQGYGVFNIWYLTMPGWWGRHLGRDYGIGFREPILSVRDGIVIFARSNGGWGNLVKIQHSGGYESWYAHLDEITVLVGQIVKEGQIIGLCGWTGFCIPKSVNGTHLHISAKKDSEWIDPLSLFENNIKYMETFEEALRRLYWDFLNRGSKPNEITARVNKCAHTVKSIDKIRKEFNTSKERKKQLQKVYKKLKKKFPKRFKSLPKFKEWYKWNVEHITPFYRIYQSFFK